MGRINVTKTFLPPIEEYERYIQRIWDNNWLTNQGPLLLEFEREMRDYLKVEHFHFVANGTLALQLALRGLDITEGEIITTPFSYVATTSAILWEHCTPAFVDIEPDTFNIDPDKIEAAITKNTKAIMAVHVFGNPCNVEKIEAVAKKHDLPVIYDAAHAFGVQYKGRALLSYGDIAACSFHSTKLFHTIEGGAVITPSKEISGKVELLKRFGHTGDEHFTLGINAKASEFNAAMGLTNLPYVEDNIKKRKELSEFYDKQLKGVFQTMHLRPGTTYNYGYYPLVFKDEEILTVTLARLEKQDVFPRRYFYPSLNKLPYHPNKYRCPISEDIANRIVCLPLYPELTQTEVTMICETIKQ